MSWVINWRPGKLSLPPSRAFRPPFALIPPGDLKVGAAEVFSLPPGANSDRYRSRRRRAPTSVQRCAGCPFHWPMRLSPTRLPNVRTAFRTVSKIDNRRPRPSLTELAGSSGGMLSSTTAGAAREEREGRPVCLSVCLSVCSVCLLLAISCRRVIATRNFPAGGSN